MGLVAVEAELQRAAVGVGAREADRESVALEDAKEAGPQVSHEPRQRVHDCTREALPLRHVTRALDRHEPVEVGGIHAVRGAEDARDLAVHDLDEGQTHAEGRGVDALEAGEEGHVAQSGLHLLSLVHGRPAAAFGVGLDEPDQLRVEGGVPLVLVRLHVGHHLRCKCGPIRIHMEGVVLQRTAKRGAAQRSAAVQQHQHRHQQRRRHATECKATQRVA